MSDEPKIVEVLYDTNFRDVAASLREIADWIDEGRYGEIGSAGVVILGDTLEIFGLGPDSEAPSVALFLHAGFSKLSRAVMEHGE